jgi:hypothetical protein
VDCETMPRLSEDEPEAVLDWLLEVSVTHNVCVGRYDDLRRAVRTRNEGVEDGKRHKDRQ